MVVTFCFTSLSPCCVADSLVSSTVLSNFWYWIDATMRTIGLLHLITASLDFYLQIRGTHPGGSLKVWISTLAGCWVLATILTVTPFACHAGFGSSVWSLVFSVFVLAFAVPLSALVGIWAILLWKRFCARNRRHQSKDICELGIMQSHEKKCLSRAASGAGSMRRQASVRGGSRRSKCPTGRSSPQLDRHPSLRYSIKRRRSNTSVSMEPTFGNKLEPGSKIVTPESPAAGQKVSPREEDTVGWLTVSGHRNPEPTGLLSTVEHFLVADKTGSGRSSRKSSKSSSKSDRGPDSPKLDRHPSLRFSTRQKHAPSSSSIKKYGGSKNNLEPLDPHLLLARLESASSDHKKLSAQSSFPETFIWPESGGGGNQTHLLQASKNRYSSGENLIRKSSSIRRSGSARNSSRRKDSKPTRPASPKLDRHPSLRFSTKRTGSDRPNPVPESRDAPIGKSKQTSTRFKFGSRSLRKLFGDEKNSSASPRTGSSSCRRANPHAGQTTTDDESSSTQQPGPMVSPGGSPVSIGTCHDLLHTSASFCSVKHLQPSGSKLGGQLDASVRGNPGLLSCQNLVRVTVSEKDLATTGNTIGVKSCNGSPTKRRRSAEDQNASALATSGTTAASSSHRRCVRRSFQRDTNHAIEDWLSLDSAKHRRPSSQQLTSHSPLRDTRISDGDDVEMDDNHHQQQIRMLLMGCTEDQTADANGFHRGTSSEINNNFKLLGLIVSSTILLNFPFVLTYTLVALSKRTSGGVLGYQPILVPVYCVITQLLSSLTCLCRPAIILAFSDDFKGVLSGLLSGRCRPTSDNAE